MKFARGKSEFAPPVGAAEVAASERAGEAAERVRKEAVAVKALNGTAGTRDGMTDAVENDLGVVLAGDEEDEELVDKLAEYGELKEKLGRAGAWGAVSGRRLLGAHMDERVGAALRAMGAEEGEGFDEY